MKNRTSGFNTVTETGRFLFTVQEAVGLPRRVWKQQVCIVHIFLINSQKANNSCIVISTVNRKVTRRWVTCDVTLFSCSCKTTKKPSHMLHTPRLKKASEQIHPLCLHPFRSCWYLASHVCYHYIPLSRFTEGWGTRPDLSSVQNKRTMGNFAFEGINMCERSKWVRARGMSLCGPIFNLNMHEQMHPLPQSNRWKCVSNCAWWAPHSLLSPSVLRTAGRQTFHLLSFQWKTKECGTPPRHTCIFPYPTSSPPQKKKK